VALSMLLLLAGGRRGRGWGAVGAGGAPWARVGRRGRGWGAVGAGGAPWVGQEAVAVTYTPVASARVWLLVLPATLHWEGPHSAGPEHEGQQPRRGHTRQRRHEEHPTPDRCQLGRVPLR
jgi:hypothetical protein